MESQREKVRDLDEKLRDARKELLEACVAEKFDEEGIRKKAMTAAKLEAELTVVRAKALSQVHPRLSDEQLERLKSPVAPGWDGVEGQPPRRRSDVPRDEHGLPIKERPGAEKNNRDQPPPK